MLLLNICLRSILWMRCVFTSKLKVKLSSQFYSWSSINREETFRKFYRNIPYLNTFRLLNISKFGALDVTENMKKVTQEFAWSERNSCITQRHTQFSFVYSYYFVLRRIRSVPHLWSKQPCFSLSPFYNKLKTYFRLAKRPNDGKPHVLDSTRKYCELIGQKWYSITNVWIEMISPPAG